jgi:hypothetical protein
MPTDRRRRPTDLETSMRHPFRFLAPVLALAAIVLGGASSALAAATPSSASLDANWCFQDASTQYCFDVTGTVQDLDTKPGSSVNIHQITRTTAYESGQFVGEAMSVTADRFVFEADGTVVIQAVVRTRSSIGDEACTYHMVLRLADYEAVVYQVTSTCGD